MPSRVAKKSLTKGGTSGCLAPSRSMNSAKAVFTIARKKMIILGAARAPSNAKFSGKEAEVKRMMPKGGAGEEEEE
eukprot:2045379-Alexandrium_andersonii.AAC.1